MQRELAILLFPVLLALAVALFFIWRPHVRDLIHRCRETASLEITIEADTSAAQRSLAATRVAVDRAFSQIAAQASAARVDFEPKHDLPFSVTEAMRVWR